MCHLVAPDAQYIPPTYSFFYLLYDISVIFILKFDIFWKMHVSWKSFNHTAQKHYFVAFVQPLMLLWLLFDQLL